MDMTEENEKNTDNARRTLPAAAGWPHQASAEV
jgi:hypothetical protein